MAHAITRRSFLKTGVGLIAISIAPVVGLAQSSPEPGFARQRIDGLAKVTGQKVFARDFSAAHMGWRGHQWYALYARALTTDRVFQGFNIAALPPHARPAKLVYGDELHATARAPRLTGKRDLHLDHTGSFDKPAGYDLVVQRGKAPDYLGQAVALLLFDSRAAYRAAKAAMRFQDEAFQTYGAAVPAAPSPPYTPTTHFVRYDQPEGDFSYAQRDHDTYIAEAPFFADRVRTALQRDPALFTHSFTADMRAMDPMFMEPEAGLVWQEDHTLHLVLGTQSPDGDIKDIAAMYDSPDAPIKLQEITLKSCYPGGGFGGRDSSPFSLMLALCAPFTQGNPVRLAYDRFEQFRVGLKRHACTLSGTLAVAPDMKIKVNQMDFTFDGGGRRNLSPYVAQLAGLCASGAYNIPMADVRAEATHSENISAGSQRGFGGPQAYFAIETALDDICIAKGWNPFDLRYRNLLQEGDRTVSGGKIEQSLRLSEMLDIARAHPVWADRARIKARHTAKGESYGTGMAMSLQAYGTSGDGVVAAIEIGPDGALAVTSDAVDMGNGSATTLATVIGKYLGRNAARIEMGAYQLFPDTHLKTTKGGAWSDPDWTAKGVGSSSACLTGLHQVHVVEQAAKALFLAALLPAAKYIWNLRTLSAADTYWQDGYLYHRHRAASPLAQARLAQQAYALRLPKAVLAHGFIQGSWVSADYDIGGFTRLELDSVSLQSSGSNGWEKRPRHNTTPPKGNPRAGRYAYAPAVNLIGLTVNTASGRVQIEHAVTVLNAGKVHVEPLVSGQAQGGLAMALGWALLEDMPPGMDGPANGDWNLNRYHVPRYRDLPLYNGYKEGTRSQALITLPAEGSHTGRGIAEAVMVSVAPAISNAIKDATGLRFTSLPITAAKILEGLA